MKTSKRIVSFLLSAIMVVTTFLAVGPVFTIEAEAADITLSDGNWGITQQRVVAVENEAYKELYADYQARFFGGETDDNWPTNFVIPGLSETDDYVPQGMTYWAEKEWILISAYDKSGQKRNSVIYALDAKTTDFVALFKIRNKKGDTNLSHGGGIAASEHNFYYADTDAENDTGSRISYWPLAEMDVDPGTVKYVSIYDTLDCGGELNGSNASYCCYDEGVLWTGNFFYDSDSYEYDKKANSKYNSMLIGYKLVGSNSADEWAYLKGRYNKPINITLASGQATKEEGTINWNAKKTSGLIAVSGSITAPKAYVGEFTANFGSFELKEGKDYTIEFISTNRSSDLYMFAPNGNHCNVKQAQTTTITPLDNGTFHYKMSFTAGLKPTGADSKWPTTQSTDGTYTGTYTIRFDQDAIQAGEARNFIISNIRISETPISALKNKVDQSTASRNNDNGSGTTTWSYNIAYNENNGTLNITGDVTNTGTTGTGYVYTDENYMVAPLIEGESYTLEYVANSEWNYVYVWAPEATGSNNYLSLDSIDTVEDLGGGKYRYTATFTAGEKPANFAGTENRWPEVQSLDGTYTGFYKFRFYQDRFPANQTKRVEITDIKLKKTDESRLDLISPRAGAAGDPTYCIAFNDDIDKVQYAMVDKGRIYISRSWGRKYGGTHIRELAIGNININAPGTEPLTINGSTRLCHVVNPGDVTKFGGSGTANDPAGSPTEMLYMGEALCVIDDYLYMFGESAAWNYRGKESGNVCPEPIDVIWKIDQYKIMGIDRPAEDLEASHYVKVNSMDEIVDDEEYIIAYESALKDPVTQKNILYAIDAFGGYGINKLPKVQAGTTNGFTKASTGDSMGIIGYPITRYSTEVVEDENDKKETHIYFEKEDDANKSIRWKISGANGGNLRIQNMDFYYNNYPYLYFDGRIFGMSAGEGENNVNETILNSLKLEGAPNGKFYILNSNQGSRLWCVDGSNADYLKLYSNHYANHTETSYIPNYSGLEELPGTIHADGLKEGGGTTNGSGCLLGNGGVGANIHYCQFNIYKRVQDPHASVYDTRVFTDLTAELQPDGTYNLKLQAYTTNKVQYQKVDPRPTDFIFVLDASGSMTNNSDCTGYIRYGENNTLSSYSVADDDTDAGDADAFTNWTGPIYYQDADGDFHQLYLDSSARGDDGNFWSHKYYKYYWLYYKDGDTTYWYVPNNTGDVNYGGSFKTTKPTESQTMKVYGNSDSARADAAIYKGVHFRLDTTTRLQVMQNAVNQMTYKINQEAASTGLEHRIAVVQFGSDSGENYLNNGMYVNTSTSMVQYSGTNSISDTNYAKAFFTKDKFSSVRTIINNIVTTQKDPDPDTFSNYGFEMAGKIIENSDASYLAGGDRSACVIMITDGCPGVGNKNASSAIDTANKAIAQAVNIKNKGAYVYTVQMGNDSIPGFDMNGYMDYVSSEFVEATSMDDPGERNIAKVEYRMDVPTGSGFSLVELTNGMFNSVTSNSTNALAKLDENSFIREILNTDAFIFTDKTERKAGTAKAAYDGLGRLYFEDMVEGDGVTSTIDKEKNIFTVTGFDYSTRYVSPSNLGDGKAAAVVIEVTNVLPNPEKVMSDLDETDMSSVPVSVDKYTGVYQNERNMSDDINFKQKGFPVERIQIPEYTYALDYGTEMLDIDINGILKSVSPELTAQRDENGNISYNPELNTNNAGIKIASNSLDLIYSIKPTTDGKIDNSKGYVLIQRLDGTYDWFRINVVPASNVYYEETSITRNASSSADWVSKGKAEFTGQDIASSNDVYGKDSRYVNSTKAYSNDTYYQATVSESNKTSDTASFTFSGTGFDLYSACGTNTGIQVIKVRKGDTVLKTYIVDTYYSDATYAGMMTQVPIVRYSGDYGVYTVESTAAYLPSMSGAFKAQSLDSQVIGEDGVISYTADFAESYENEILKELGFKELIGTDVEIITFSEDSVLNGGEGPFAVDEGAFTTQATLTSLENYIDGIRVYNPLDRDNSNYIPSEQNVQYFNVIDSLASSSGMVEGSGDNKGVAFIQGSFADGFTFADYNKAATGAPKNEFYLKGDTSTTNALTFNVKGWSPNKRVMISARVASGSSVTMQVNDNETLYPLQNKAEVYYDITQLAELNEAGDVATFAIFNKTPGTLLAINNIKVTDSTNAVQPITFGSLSVVEDILNMPVTKVDINAPVYPIPDDVGELPEVSPIIPDENPEPDNGDKEPVVDEPSDDTFFTKIDLFFKKIFAFFKNIFDKVFSIFNV